jgi:ABC-type polar amino acid transport system ATPase subunit
VGAVAGIGAERKREGMTMLIATNEMGFARALAGEVCHPDGGQIVKGGGHEQSFSERARQSTCRFPARVPAGPCRSGVRRRIGRRA